MIVDEQVETHVTVVDEWTDCVEEARSVMNN